MTLTPMMQQYRDAKAAAGDALLLFRMGDFYELFFDDAKIAARELGLSLTSRDRGENPVPMAGFPHHQLESYLAKIIARGLRAAVCEQLEDPRHAKGIVKRDVTRIVSRGTVTDDALLDARTSNYLAALTIPGSSPAHGARPACGLAWIDLSTGRFEATTVPHARLGDELARVAPVEILLRDDADDLPDAWTEGRMVTIRPAWSFGREAAEQSLARHFGVHSLDGFGFADDDGPAIQAAGAILDYLAETQKSSLGHVDRLVPYARSSRLEIDESTRRSLEITATIRDGRREGSLLGVMDRTVTAMGGRMLGGWLAAPLAEPAAIDARLDAVAELHADVAAIADLREALGPIYDMERLLARVTTGRATPRDLSFIGRTLRALPKVKAKLAGRKAARLVELEDKLDLCPDVRTKLEAALADDCPLAARDGGFIRPGYHADLDAQRELAKGGKQWIAAYQADAVRRTGISTMKVGFNSVFGYYLEVTHAQRDKVPPDFIRKQTLKNAERYVTPELKEHEEKVLAAEEKSKDLEYDLFIELRETVAAAAKRIQSTAAALAEIDVLTGLADLARSRNYVRPAIVADPVLDIEFGRHPVLDATEAAGTFVPNDVSCEARGARRERNQELATRNSELETRASRLAPRPSLLLITGPNMAGKSTYIRQTALLVLMAQVGSFVPARSATIGVADRIFARVGASDDLARGRSTFMVEMTETARILNTATPRSLVILDEIGRGTSTYDGLSLAWAVVEHLHDAIGCRTLFATHYHELTDLAERLAGVANFNVAVREWQDTVVFLHQIVPGAADKSYGIHVAKLAGVPREVNDRAAEVLAELESGRHEAEAHIRATGPLPLPAEVGHAEVRERSASDGFSRPDGPHRRGGDTSRLQLTLFEATEDSVVDALRAADIERLTPAQALALIADWQQQLAGARRPALK
jgi:DNA mismatch repair protein MutS